MAVEQDMREASGKDQASFWLWSSKFREVCADGENGTSEGEGNELGSIKVGAEI